MCTERVRVINILENSHILYLLEILNSVTFCKRPDHRRGNLGGGADRQMGRLQSSFDQTSSDATNFGHSAKNSYPRKFAAVPNKSQFQIYSCLFLASTSVRQFTFGRPHAHQFVPVEWTHVHSKLLCLTFWSFRDLEFIGAVVLVAGRCIIYAGLQKILEVQKCELEKGQKKRYTSLNILFTSSSLPQFFLMGAKSLGHRCT